MRVTNIGDLRKFAILRRLEVEREPEAESWGHVTNRIKSRSRGRYLSRFDYQTCNIQTYNIKLHSLPLLSFVAFGIVRDAHM